MKCVAEARDGRTKDAQVFRAHLRDNQSLSRSPWERLEAVNLSQFIRFHWAWSLAELRGNEASWFLVRGAESSRDCRQGSQFSLQNCPSLGASFCLPCFSSALLIGAASNANDARLCWALCTCSEPSWLLSLCFCWTHSALHWNVCCSHGRFLFLIRPSEV